MGTLFKGYTPFSPPVIHDFQRAHIPASVSTTASESRYPCLPISLPVPLPLNLLPSLCLTLPDPASLPTHEALTKASFPKHFQTKKERNESSLPFLSNIFAGGRTGTLRLLFACFIISPRGNSISYGFLPLDRAILLKRV